MKLTIEKDKYNIYRKTEEDLSHYKSSHKIFKINGLTYYRYPDSYREGDQNEEVSVVAVGIKILKRL